MNSTKKLKIWGRNLELEVIYDCYKGEKILPSQIEALQVFIDNIDAVNSSLEMVKNYCIKRDGDNILENTITNIFKYVMPQVIFIKRPRVISDSPLVALMCAYRFDEDDGIAVIFKNGVFIEVNNQNTLL